MKMPLSSYVYAAALLTAAVPVAPPSHEAPGPSLKTPPLPRIPWIVQSPRTDQPRMTNIPRSYLVGGLQTGGGQTFFTGPNGSVGLGPMQITIVPCSSTARTAQRR